MVKDVLNYLGRYTTLAEIGLLIFFVVFVAVVIRVLTRSRGEVTAWSRLPLEDDGPLGEDETNGKQVKR